MKTAYQIFKNEPELLDDPAVKELISNYEELSDQLIDLQQISERNKEVPLKELVDQILKAIDHELKDDENSIRFKETPRVDFKQSLTNLKSYILKYTYEYGIRM